MTKSLRGAANIKKFNEDRERQAILHIKNELAKCKKHKLTYKSLGALAEYVGAITGIHRTTLMRNPRYKILLVEYTGVQDPRMSTVRDEDAPPEVLRARLLGLRLEMSNIQEKFKRLEAYVKEQGEQPLLFVSSQDAMAAPSSDSADYLFFVDTAMTLTTLLHHFKDTLVINFEKKTIEDISLRPSQRLVVGPERASTYLAWLHKQKQLLLGFNYER